MFCLLLIFYNFLLFLTFSSFITASYIFFHVRSEFFKQKDEWSKGKLVDLVSGYRNSRPGLVYWILRSTWSQRAFSQVFRILRSLLNPYKLQTISWLFFFFNSIYHSFLLTFSCLLISPNWNVYSRRLQPLSILSLLHTEHQYLIQSKRSIKALFYWHKLSSSPKIF